MSEFEKSEKMEKEKIGEETALVSPVGCRTGMMMNLRLWMVALFLLAAVGLLGGCAQSSGDADPDTEDDTTMMEDMDDEDMDDEDMMEEETPRGPYQVAVEESNKAKNAAMMANAAKDNAKKYAGMLEVLDVGGESGSAMENAQKVLDAETTVKSALDDANEALAALEAAKEVADEDAMAELNKVIADVEKYIADINAILDAKGGTSLTGFIKKVNDYDDKKPIVKIGLKVAEAIQEAIPGIAQIEDDGVPSDALLPVNVHKGEDTHVGMTFSEIVDKIVEKEVVGTDPTTGEATKSTKVVKAVSVDGEIVPVDNSDDPRITCTDTAPCTDGKLYSSAASDPFTWSGEIAGNYFCDGKCEIDGKNFKGDWYFTPTDDKKFYVDNDDDPITYSVETNYAVYGYWLSQATPEASLVFTPYAKVATDVTTAVDVGIENSDFKDREATYKGGAIGMSIQGTGDNMKSGHFDADVSLDVTFATQATIEGKISNFRGNAVDGDWEVTLNKGDLTAAGVLANGETGASRCITCAGTWNATAYGQAVNNVSQRPTGFFGTFNANFSDGEASGAYATRK